MPPCAPIKSRLASSKERCHSVAAAFSFASSVPLEHSLINGTMPCASAIVRSLSGSGFVASTNANVPAYLSRAPLVPEEGRQHEGL